MPADTMLTAPLQATQYFEANCAALAAVSRRLVPAGQPGRRVEQVWSADRLSVFVRPEGGARLSIHSEHDPRREAAQWLSTSAGDAPRDLIVVIGLGLGYVLDVLEQVSPNTRVLAIEPLPDLIEPLLLRRDWTRWLRSRQLTLLVGPHYEGRAEAWRLIGAREPALLVHPVLEQGWPREADTAKTIWTRIAFDAKANASARAANASRYLLNTLRNLDRIDAEGDVAALAGVLEGIPAVVVGAGPSLDDSLDDLVAVRDRTAIIAVDTALRPLLTAGIEPDLVVAADPTDGNARHLEGAPMLPSTWLLTEPSVAPSALAPFDGRIFTFALGHDPWPWLRQMGLGRGGLRAWGSVATSAFDFALIAKADPIAFVGLDFAFTDNRPYCRGTVYEDDWACAVAAGRALDEVWEGWISRWKAVAMPDIVGTSTRTAPHLVAFRDWVREQVRQTPGRRFINSSRGILHGEGIECATLVAALSPLPRQRDRIVKRLAAAHRPMRRPSLRVEAQRLADQARAHAAAQGDRLDGNRHAVVIRDWIAFSAGGAAAAHMASALETGLQPNADAGRAVAARQAWAGLPIAEDIETLARILAPWRARMEAVGAGRLSDTDANLLDQASAALASLLSAPGPVAAEVCAGRDAADVTAAGTRRIARVFDAVTRGGQKKVAVMSPFWHATPEPVARDVAEGGPLPLDETVRYVVARECALVALASRGTHSPSASRMATLLGAATPSLMGDARVSLMLTMGSERRLQSTLVPLPGLARGLTGCLSESATDGDEPARGLALEIAEPGLQVLVEPAGVGQASARQRSRRDPRERLLCGAIGAVTPTVLTECGLPPALLVTQAHNGTAWATPIGGDFGYTVHEDGRFEPRAPWPRPVLGETPWDDRGSVLAWHNAPVPYVMLKTADDAPVVVEAIGSMPCGPVLVHDGRALWAGGGGGLWAWAPGRGSECLADVPPSFGVRLDGNAVRLDSRATDERGSTKRTTAGAAWRWRPGAAEVDAVAIGEEGPCWSAAAALGWTAEAFPHADLIRLSTGSGRVVWLGCDFPVSVAWAGRSLLVVSSTGGTLLLFRDLQAALDPAFAG